MKKFALSLLCLMLLLQLMPASAQEGGDLSDIRVRAIDTRLDLGKRKVEDFEALTQLLDKHPQLTQVDMYETIVKREQAETLSARYPQIRFGWTLHLVEKHRIRTDATAYAINHNKRSKTHTSEDFELLKYCTELRALDLGHNAITDIGFMENLTELRVIILAGNYISDIGVLAKLKNLEYAELFNNRIEDFSPLTGLNRLIDLNICFNQSEDLSPLHSMTQLDRLWLYNSNNRDSDDPVDPEQVAALQAALPQCTIDSVHYSTAGGWREHERYYVVFNMLHGAVAWLPWTAPGLVPRYN